MKKIVTRGSIFVILLLMPILAVDYYVDAYASFRLTYNKIGRIGIVSNYSVGEEIALSERKPKWAKIINMDHVDNVLLGSSRSMLFSSDNLGLDSFFNLAVSSGCCMNDYLAEVYILMQNQKLPSNVLIEIGPALFNKNSEDNNWPEWGNCAEYMRSILEGENCNKNDSYVLGIRISDILSPSYFRYNFELFKKKKRSYIVVHDSYEDDLLATQHIDGSYAYSRQEQENSNAELISEKTKRVCEERSIHNLSNFNELDQGLVSEFEELVSFLVSNNVDVSFYLPPYSDEMYGYMSKDVYYESVFKVEEYIIDYAYKNGLQVYGSYNPKYCGLTTGDLYDSYHIKADRIVDTLWPRNPNVDSFWIKGV